MICTRRTSSLDTFYKVHTLLISTKSLGSLIMFNIPMFFFLLMKMKKPLVYILRFYYNLNKQYTSLFNIFTFESYLSNISTSMSFLIQKMSGRKVINARKIFHWRAWFQSISAFVSRIWFDWWSYVSQNGIRWWVS